MEIANRYAEAEPLMRRALAINEKRFGPEHPDVVRDLNNLAWLLEITNRHAERSFGPEDEKAAIRLNNLA